MARIGFVEPAMLRLEIAASVLGCLGACVKLTRRTLISKAKRYYEIITLVKSKLNSIKTMDF